MDPLYSYSMGITPQFPYILTYYHHYISCYNPIEVGFSMILWLQVRTFKWPQLTAHTANITNSTISTSYSHPPMHHQPLLHFCCNLNLLAGQDMQDIFKRHSTSMMQYTWKCRHMVNPSSHCYCHPYIPTSLFNKGFTCRQWSKSVPTLTLTSKPQWTCLFSIQEVLL